MDVSKLFQKSPEQGEIVVPSTKRGGVIKPQKPEILNPDLEETQELSDAENEGWPTSDGVDNYYTPPLSGMSPVEVGRHPLATRFHELLKEIGELHDKKQKDYGIATDPYANVRGATEFGLPAPMGSFIAMSDIMSRIKSFCQNGSLENEPLENALKDMAVYSLIALVLYEEENGKVG